MGHIRGTSGVRHGGDTSSRGGLIGSISKGLELRATRADGALAAGARGLSRRRVILRKDIVKLSGAKGHHRHARPLKGGVFGKRHGSRNAGGDKVETLSEGLGTRIDSSDSKEVETRKKESTHSKRRTRDTSRLKGFELKLGTRIDSRERNTRDTNRLNIPVVLRTERRCRCTP